MRLSRIVFAGLLSCALALAAGGCRTTPAATVACGPGDAAMVRDTLFFGRHRPDGGIVDDAQWRAFVDDTLTLRFPDGLTILSGSGQWRGGDGRIEREPSEVVTILHAGDAASRRAIDEIVDAYKQRHAQESVLRVRDTACARF